MNCPVSLNCGTPYQSLHQSQQVQANTLQCNALLWTLGASTSPGKTHFGGNAVLSGIVQGCSETRSAVGAQVQKVAKQAAKTVKKAAPKIPTGARKTVRERAGWWGDVRLFPLALIQTTMSLTF